MNAGRRLPLVGGLLLIVVGGVLLAAELIPGWEIEFTWPWIIIAVGIGLFVLGLLTGQPDMVIPACIVAGVGGILYYQDASGNWESWGYLWPVIPACIGIGTILAGLLRGDLRRALREGGKSILFGAVAFVIMAAIFGVLGEWGSYWPVVLILAGVVGVIWALLPQRIRSGGGEE